MLTSGIIPTSFACAASRWQLPRRAEIGSRKRRQQDEPGIRRGFRWGGNVDPGLGIRCPDRSAGLADLPRICRSPGRPLAARSSAAASTIRCDAMASRPLSRSLDSCGATSVITWSSRLSAALPDSRSACSRTGDLCSSSRCCSKRRPARSGGSQASNIRTQTRTTHERERRDHRFERAGFLRFSRHPGT